MSKFTASEIQNLKNAYLDLGGPEDISDLIAEHLTEIASLSDEDQKKLAVNLVTNCPNDKIKDLQPAVEASKNNSDTRFYDVFQRATHVKKIILALMDPVNKNPHRMLAGTEFNLNLFKEFNEITSQTLLNNETAIAQHLAATTPENLDEEILKNVNAAFSKSETEKSEFETKLINAFKLRHNIDNLLLKGKAAEFFTDASFDVDVCLEFSSLLTSKIAGHEKRIGSELALVNDNKVRSDIGRSLEKIDPHAANQASPFKLIASIMATPVIIADPTPAPTPAPVPPATTTTTTTTTTVTTAPVTSSPAATAPEMDTPVSNRSSATAAMNTSANRFSFHSNIPQAETAGTEQVDVEPSRPWWRPSCCNNNK